MEFEGILCRWRPSSLRSHPTTRDLAKDVSRKVCGATQKKLPRRSLGSSERCPCVFVREVRSVFGPDRVTRSGGRCRACQLQARNCSNCKKHCRCDAGNISTPTGTFRLAEHARSHAFVCGNSGCRTERVPSLYIRRRSGGSR